MAEQTKADIVRDLIKKNPETGPTALVEKAKAKHPDMKLSTQEVSTYKSQLRQAGEIANGKAGGKGKPGRKPKKKLGRPKGSKNKVGRPKGKPSDSIVRLAGVVQLKEAVEAVGGKEIARQLLDIL